jgi:hypothetical protein
VDLQELELRSTIEPGLQASQQRRTAWQQQASMERHPPQAGGLEFLFFSIPSASKSSATDF